MFLGTFDHSLDTKGRVILPARFREQLEGGAVVTQGLDGCLTIHTTEEFEELAASMQEKARRGSVERQAVRAFFAGAAEVELDGQGRISLPQHLRSFAGLRQKVVVIGAHDHIELWDPKQWDGVSGRGNQSLATAQPGLDDLL